MDNNKNSEASPMYLTLDMEMTEKDSPDESAPSERAHIPEKPRVCLQTMIDMLKTLSTELEQSYQRKDWGVVDDLSQALRLTAREVVSSAFKGDADSMTDKMLQTFQIVHSSRLQIESLFGHKVSDPEPAAKLNTQEANSLVKHTHPESKNALETNVNQPEQDVSTQNLKVPAKPPKEGTSRFGPGKKTSSPFNVNVSTERNTTPQATISMAQVQSLKRKRDSVPPSKSSTKENIFTNLVAPLCSQTTLGQNSFHTSAPVPRALMGKSTKCPTCYSDIPQTSGSHAIKCLCGTKY